MTTLLDTCCFSVNEMDNAGILQQELASKRRLPSSVRAGNHYAPRLLRLLSHSVNSGKTLAVTRFQVNALPSSPPFLS